MRALFPPWTNTAFRVALFLGVVGAIAALAYLMIYARSPYHTNEHRPVIQPIQFDHRHHVADDGIDCRYCHQTAWSSPSAGIPSTSLCLNCHSQIWNKSPLLDPLRAAYFTGEPIRWRRVHRLPDYVYFDHSIHVAKGVGCESCHGRVDEMPAVEMAAPLSMKWCLDCHRDPTPRIRPREAITQLGWTPSEDPGLLAAKLAIRYQLHTRTSCTTCHR